MPYPQGERECLEFYVRSGGANARGRIMRRHLGKNNLPSPFQISLDEKKERRGKGVQLGYVMRILR
jgi:hypothetical protein